MESFYVKSTSTSAVQENAAWTPSLHLLSDEQIIIISFFRGFIL